ncbi:nuclease [Flexibacterium corallicola]|uniref:nuclease n=1 Tax=Flexibacterium corallicola TaxID=3037259 RepID=UPI00286ED1BD|nr:nuclease [Pseudovibrio sp. M1P-2-3]
MPLQEGFASPVLSLNSNNQFLNGNGKRFALADVDLQRGQALLRMERWLKGSTFATAFPVAEKPSRWGEWPSVIFDRNKVNLSETLISEGLAIVRPRFGTPACLKRWLLLEKKARDLRLGLWKKYRAINAEDPDLSKQYGLFQIVEGKVLSIGRTRSVIYLNFGKVWTRDFTGIIQRGNVKDFERVHGDLEDLKEKRVRLRGVIQLRGGPQILLDHPAQFEILDTGPPES